MQFYNGGDKDFRNHFGGEGMVNCCKVCGFLLRRLTTSRIVLLPWDMGSPSMKSVDRAPVMVEEA